MTSPLPTGQAPGFHRRRVGKAIVTAINDGGNPAVHGALLNISADDVAALLRQAGRTPPMLTTINAFVVQVGGQTVLIDTGAGNLMSPTAGRLLGNLAAAGIAPADIDTVLLTHMHIDHVGGLIDAAGQPAFPNAALLVPQEEATFWLDEAKAAAAPEPMRPSFALARRATAPYGSRLRAFTEAEPAPGIAAVKLPGHTPGHTGYRVGAGEDQLLIWGDVFHVPDVQSRHPEVGVMYDIDGPTAIATRRAILAEVADAGTLVAGMHLHFPAFVRIVREGGAYAVRPIAWLPVL